LVIVAILQQDPTLAPSTFARKAGTTGGIVTAGYSATPLLKKLGYAGGQRACLVAVPLAELRAFDFAARRLLKDVRQVARAKGPFDLIHLFVTEATLLPAALAAARERLVPNGMIWVSWPKQAAKVMTDVTENVVRREALAAGLVDVKVCAVDATWSGLKLVIPRAARG
jgi:Protein of unknown function (DUF3052)